MKSVGDMFGMPPERFTLQPSSELVQPDCRVGVEIELESLSCWSNAFTERLKPYWNVVEDHSLRNRGREFVTSGDPILFGQDLVTALERFDDVMGEYISDYRLPPATTNRTSVHIHIDARPLTVYQLQRWAILHYVFEEALFQWAGDGRINNNYCLSSKRHKYFQSILRDIISSERTFKEAVSGGQKYAAFNVSSIRKYGSIETRIMRGTYDGKLIKKWINILLSIRKYAIENEFDLSDIPAVASSKGMVQFMHEVFGDLSSEFEFVTDKMILDGVRRVERAIMFNTLAEVSLKFNNQGVRHTDHFDLLISGLAPEMLAVEK